jgi:hypothetical protein
MDQFCPQALGPRALQECASAAATTTTPKDTIVPYLNRYYYGDSDSAKDEQLLSKFCTLMSELSGFRGRQCLLPLCSRFEGTDDAPTWSTDVPTFAPTKARTLVPSLDTTRVVVPSGSSTLVPTSSPNQVPKSKPPSTTFSNTTDVPSALPSWTPTSTIPDIVQVRFFTRLTFWNVSLSNLSTSERQELQTALEEALSSVLEESMDDESVRVEVLSIEEDSTTIPISATGEIQVGMERESFWKDQHSQVVDELLDQFQAVLNNALSSGALEEAIQKVKVQQISPELESISVMTHPQSPLVRFSSQVHESNSVVIPKAFSGVCKLHLATGLLASGLVSLWLLVGYPFI